jgi:hypothetical protein
MPTVRTESGKVVLKNGRVACECCQIACGANVVYTGGQSFPSTREILLGSALGTVTLGFNAFNFPDRFVVIFDGVEVIDTGYRGLGIYGIPVVGPGLGTASFFKATETPTATVEVYAPLEDTVWIYVLNCPVAAP